MNTTKNMIILALLFGMIQACAPSTGKTDEAIQWDAISDPLLETEYVAMVEEHPATQNAAEDLRALGCTLEYENGWADESRLEKESPQVRVRIPFWCGDSREESASEELTIVLGGDVIVDVQHISAELKFVRALDTHIQKMMWHPGENLHTNPANPDHEPF